MSCCSRSAVISRVPRLGERPQRDGVRARGDAQHSHPRPEPGIEHLVGRGSGGMSAMRPTGGDSACRPPRRSSVVRGRRPSAARGAPARAPNPASIARRSRSGGSPLADIGIAVQTGRPVAAAISVASRAPSNVGRRSTSTRSTSASARMPDLVTRIAFGRHRRRSRRPGAVSGRAPTSGRGPATSTEGTDLASLQSDLDSLPGQADRGHRPLACTA